jgi:hypothetical protein
VPDRCGACLNSALNDEALMVIIAGAMRGLGGAVVAAEVSG